MVNVKVTFNDPSPEVQEISRLLKLATKLADERHYDAAIENALRAYSLMESVVTQWPIETYFRVARYLHLSERHREAVEWLQMLHGNVDSMCDAREALYRQNGLMMSRDEPAKISQELRESMREQINSRIDLYQRRKAKVEGKARKHASRSAASSYKGSVLGADVNEILFNFSQHCFIGEGENPSLDRSAQDFVFGRLADPAPLTAVEVCRLPSKHRAILRELLSQYVIFLEMNRDLEFPESFLTDSANGQLGAPVLQYMSEHRWPFPQSLPPAFLAN